MTEVQLRTLHSFIAGLGSSTSQLFWYTLLAGTTWLGFYVVFRNRLRHRRIGQKVPTKRQVAFEIFCSLRSIAVFGLVATFVVYASFSGWTRLYFRVQEFGWGWFALSVVLMVVLHDAYFYWSHRLLHHPWLFSRFHRTHHRSTNPTPWAAYNFSTIEAFVQAGIGPLIIFTIPVHPAAFGLFMIWQITFNVFGHCGYEIFPHWFIRSRLGRLLNSVTHHSLHHEKFNSNFGLYFNVWDRLMSTNHPDYVSRFEQATQLRQDPDI